MSKKQMTNHEFLTQAINFSKFGALVEVFIIEAVARYSEEVVKADIKQIQSGFINPEAWQGVGRELLEKINKRYNNVSDNKEMVSNEG